MWMLVYSKNPMSKIFYYSTFNVSVHLGWLGKVSISGVSLHTFRTYFKSPKGQTWILNFYVSDICFFSLGRSPTINGREPLFNGHLVLRKRHICPLFFFVNAQHLKQGNKFLMSNIQWKRIKDLSNPLFTTFQNKTIYNIDVCSMTLELPSLKWWSIWRCWRMIWSNLDKMQNVW